MRHWVPWRSVPARDGLAETDGERLHINAAPAGGEVVAQFVEEDEHAEHHHEGGDGAGDIRENVRQGREPSFRSARSRRW